jgi:hypothetical protein
MRPSDLRAAGLAYLTGQDADGPAPAAVGQKFTPDGQVLPYPGNTFICHIPAGAAHDALAAAAERLRSGPVAGAFAFLPPSSYHMTVFEGVTDRDRQAGRWPDWIDPSAPVEFATSAFLPRVRGLALPPAVTIRPSGLFGGFSVRVDGATDPDRAALRQAREALRAATGIRRADFDSYGFHITLAYLLRWLTPDEAERVLDLSDAAAAGLAAAAPVIPLGGVDFCTFPDMRSFPLVARLS